MSPLTPQRHSETSPDASPRGIGFGDLPRWLLVVAVVFFALSTIDDQMILWSGGKTDLRRVANSAAQLSAAGCLLALAARQARVANALLGITLVTAAVGLAPVPGLAALAAAGFVHGVRQQPRQLGATTAAAAVWLAVLAYALPQARPILIWQASPALVVLAGTGWLLGRSRARRIAAEDQAVRLARAVDEARRMERRLLARELHDVVAHGLTLITLQAGVMSATDDPARRDRAGATIETTARASLTELHRLLGVLRSSNAVASADGLAGGDGRAPDLPALVDGQAAECERLGHPLTAAVDVGDLPAGVALAADRIVRESVANTLKHAAPGGWTLTLQRHDDDLVITAQSPLGERPRVESPQLGLTGLTERVRLLGGTLIAGATMGTWRLEARIPCTSR